MEIKVVKNILKANDELAQRNRDLLNKKEVFFLNIMASPGAGKTTFILKLAELLKDKVRMGVIEGDVYSSVDAEKVAAAGIPVIQINTEGGCHLEAIQVQGTLDSLPLADLDLLIVENVGNLICTAGYDLGEHKRMVLASVPEGDDKPYKYPKIFSLVDAVVVTKEDLKPYMDFNQVEFDKAIRTINKDVGIYSVSGKTGEGMEKFCDWLMEQMKA
jgi:hydrogenase nickel incorporation protein HypB